MTSGTLGKSTSVEVTNISQHGLWLYWEDREFFLPFETFPWFKNATVAQIHNVKLEGPEHLYWEDLDIDLSRSTLEHPEAFPLIAKQ